MNTLPTPDVGTEAVPLLAAADPAATLRLKNHVFFRDTPQGVAFDAGSRAFVLQGTGTWPLVARVLGLMDQGTTLAQLQQALPARLQPLVQRLLAALHGHDMLIDDRDDRALLLEADAPAPLRAFVQHLQDRSTPAQYRPRLAAWRQATVLLAGDGHALRAAARALADAGAGTLRLRVQADTVPVAVLQQHLEGTGVRGQRTDVQAAAWTDADFDGAALALFVSDAADAADAALAFDAAARRHGVPALAAARFGGPAFVAPLAEDGVAGLHELLQWQPADDGSAAAHSPASLALLGAVAAQQALDWHFDLDVARLRRQAQHVSPWFDITQHPLLGAGGTALQPLPPGAHAVQVELPPGRTLASYEQLRLDLAPWFDRLTGPLVAPPPGQGALPQLPLYHDAIAVRAPRSAGAGLHTVAGWGLNAEQAGTRALAAAVTQLARAVLPAEHAAPWVTAFGEDRWRALALAHAVAASPAFVQQRHAAWLQPAPADDGVLHLLRQLLRHFDTRSPRFLLQWHPQHLAFVAQVFLGDTLAGSACDTQPRSALHEAVGQACSLLQVGADRASRGPVWELAAPQAGQWQPAPALDATASATVLPLVRWRRAHELALPPGVVCGHAVLLSGVQA